MSQKDTPITVTPTSLKYAGFWIRFLAFIIDGAIISTFSQLIINNRDVFTESFGPANGVGFPIQLFYTIIFWIWLSATPGKWILKLKIIKENGDKIDGTTAIIRYFSYFLSFLVFCIGFIIIGFDPKKQGWHDKLAKTYVVHK